MPRARGLFHKAVLQSGSLNLTRSVDQALAVARQVLDEVGVAPERAHALRDVPAPALRRGDERPRRALGAAAVSPVADGDLIRARPFEALAEGSARGVPLIVGTNVDEMNLYRFSTPASTPSTRRG